MDAKKFRLLVPMFPLLVAATIFYVAGTSKNELVCDRAMGLCSFTDGVLGGTTTPIPLVDIREAKYLGKLGKYGGDGAVALVYTNGEQSERFGYGDDDEAMARTAEVQAFLDGKTPTYEYHRSTRAWMFVPALGLALSAVSILFFGLWISASDDQPTRRRRTQHFTRAAMAISTLTIIASVTSCIAM